MAKEEVKKEARKEGKKDDAGKRDSTASPGREWWAARGVKK